MASFITIVKLHLVGLLVVFGGEKTLFSYMKTNTTQTPRETRVCCEPNSATKNLRNVVSGWFYREKNTKLDLLRPIPLPNLSKNIEKHV